MEAKKQRPKWLEFLINFAMVYSIIASIFLIPYIYIRNFFSNNTKWILAVYFLFAIIYVVMWIIDKWSFFKDEWKI